MKRLLSLTLVLIMMLSLVSCGGFTQSYSAVMLVRVARNDEAALSFSSLKGTVVLNTKKTEENGTDKIHCTASLGEGSVTVSYSTDGKTKNELFTVSGGESIELSGGDIECGEKIQIIIETDGKAKDGSFKFDFEEYVSG